MTATGDQLRRSERRYYEYRPSGKIEAAIGSVLSDCVTGIYSAKKSGGEIVRIYAEPVPVARAYRTAET